MGKTAEEKEIHNFAVSVRKKTDRQLFDFFEEVKRQENTLDEELVRILANIGVKTTAKSGNEKTPKQLVRELAAMVERINSSKKDTIFSSILSKEKFMKMVRESPGFGKVTVGKLEKLINGCKD